MVVCKMKTIRAWTACPLKAQCLLYIELDSIKNIVLFTQIEFLGSVWISEQTHFFSKTC